MPEINCHIPVRLRLRGLPDDARLDALGATLARAVAARLRHAVQTIAAAQGGTATTSRAHTPTVIFKGETSDGVDGEAGGEAARVRIELCVRNAVARALAGVPLAEAVPRVVLASAQLNVAPGRERSMWELLRAELRLSRNRPEDKDADTEDFARRRAAAIEVLLTLLERVEARELLRGALDSTEPFSPVRLQILDALQSADVQSEAARDLFLYGAGHKGERIVEESFARRLAKGDGAEAVGYLESKLRGNDEALQRKAAHVVVELLKLEQSEGAERLRANLKRLRRMASDNGLLEHGALGLESMRQLVDGELALLLDLIQPIRLELRYSEIGDSFARADDEALRDLAERLAGVREDLEALSLPTLKQTDEILAQMIQAALRMTVQVKQLQDGVRTMQQVLNTPLTQADEIKALIQIRHEYICALAGALEDEDFAATIAKVDRRFSNYDRVVAGIKWSRLRQTFQHWQMALAHILEIDFGTTSLPDPNYERLVADVLKTEDAVVGKFNLPPDPAGPRAPFLTEATEIEPLVTIFTLRVAMLVQYADALDLYIKFIRHDFNEEFRREHAGELTRLLARLNDYYKGNDFQGYAGPDGVGDINRRIEK
ncbi:MAG: hypothetical protein QOJ76_2018, partial [Acidobacteriota bacterium]|nr:hypothetical protein [Acidobacteriota bacterium]